MAGARAKRTPKFTSRVERRNAAIDLVDTDPAFLGSIERLDVLDHQTGDVLARPDPFRDPDLEVEHENKQRGNSKKDN